MKALIENELQQFNDEIKMRDQQHDEICKTLNKLNIEKKNLQTRLTALRAAVQAHTSTLSKFADDTLSKAE